MRSSRGPALRLRELAVHHGADFVVNSAPDALLEVQPDGRHVRVRTPPAAWAYAAHFILEGRISGAAANADLLLRIDLWVPSGAAGIGVTGPDGQFLQETIRSGADGRTAVEFRIPVTARPELVVIRNAGRVAAEMFVERLQIYEIETDDGSLYHPEGAALPSPARPVDTLADAFETKRPARPATSDDPLVSLIMTVRNGFPFLPEALESVRRQTYPNVEIVVQDALSEDGSSELIANIADLNVFHVRERDGGIGDANNRALARCRGSIVGTIDSDNLLESGAVERAVAHFSSSPEAAVVYGSVRMISAEGRPETIFQPGPYDLLRILSCDTVIPWSTAFFNLSACGDFLKLDPDLKTCVDFDVWLRLSHLQIDYIDDVLGSTRISDNSMSCRPDNYGQFTTDKLTSLRRYVETCNHAPLRASLYRLGCVGILCWAAESIKGMVPDRVDLYAEFYERAAAVDPRSPRLSLAATRLFT